MKFEKMGMRTIKSGIAVMFCIMAAGYIVQNPFFAAIACIISMQDTVKGSMKTGLNRVRGTILGGIIGYFVVILKAGSPILSGFGIMINIYLCNTLKMNNAIVVSCVTLLSICLGIIDTNPADYAFHRVLDTSIGVVIGVLVNYILARPDYLENVQTEIREIEKTTKRFIKVRIVDKEKYNLKKIEKHVKKLDYLYVKLVDEIKYSKSDVNIEELLATIEVCREAYLHMKSIDFLQKKLYLNELNYRKIKGLYKNEKIRWEVDEDQSPVFNYHLSKILEEVEILNKFNTLT